MLDQFKCYGTNNYDKLERCQKCSERCWCKDAQDPKLLGGIKAGEEGDNAEYETSLATHTTEDIQLVEDQTDFSVRFGDLIIKVIQQCSDRPDRIAIIMMRLAGYTYEEIGESLIKMRGYKTKQAVMKDIDAIFEKNQELGLTIRKQFKIYKHEKKQIDKIIELRKKGYTYKEIGIKIDSTWRHVKWIIKKQ